MKVGIYIEPILQQRGGIRRYTEDLVKALERYGKMDYTLIGSAEVDASLAQEVVPQAALPIYHPERYQAKLNTNAYDLLVDPSHFGSFGIFPAAKRVVCIHDLSGVRFPSFHRWQTVWAHRFLLGNWARKSRGVFSVSPSMRDEIHRRFPSVHPAVVSPGTEFLSNASHQPEVSLPERYFLFMGATEPRKNLSRILVALNQLPDDIHLVLTGPSGWKYAFDDEVNTLELQERVHHLGYRARSELNHLLANAIGLVYPSIYEGFGLPVLEAMWAGCPVLTNNTGAPAVLAQGAGIKVDPLDVSAIRVGMEQLIDDPALRSICANAGRERSQAFRWETSIPRLEAYLSSLLER
jgi:glycosyltransferase involved in cell wall biosynthesis